MTIYVVTGKLGAGKTLVAVGRIKEYLEEGRKVATNLNLNLKEMVGYKSKKVRVVRMPDVPAEHDLESLGMGYDGEYQGESRNGLLVLDECGSFLNARDFNDKNRKGIQNWVIHARKKRWDVIFIIQHLEALDKQFRLMFAEHTVFCMRLDRMPIPFVSFIVKLITGFQLTFPKMHRGLVKYGSGQQAITVDTWWYRGTTLYSSYDTEQAFYPDEEQNNYTYLPPHYIYGDSTNAYKELVKKIKRSFKRFNITEKQFFFIGLIGGLVIPSYAGVLKESIVEPEPSLVTSKEVSKEEIPDPIYHLVGRLDFNNKITYLFQDEDGYSAYPEYDGYKIRPIHECKVALFKKGRAIYSRCPKPSGVDFMSGPDGVGKPNSHAQTSINNETNLAKTGEAVQPVVTQDNSESL